jgi:hypothetical protein
MPNNISGVLFFTVTMAAIAHADVVAGADVEVMPLPPESVQLNELTSNTDIFIFGEVSNLLLPFDLHVDAAVPGNYTSPFLAGGTITAGTVVNSYLVHSDPTAGFPLFYNDRTLTFSNGEEIVGLIMLAPTLNETTSLLGAPGTLYPPAPAAWGLEFALEPDSILWAGSTITWNTLTGGGHDSGGEDNIRILTVQTIQTPEPQPWFIAATGLGLLLGWWQLTRQHRQRQ